MCLTGGPAPFFIASVNGQTSLEQLPVGTLVFWGERFNTVEWYLLLEMLVANPYFRQRWAEAQLCQADNPSCGVGSGIRKSALNNQRPGP